MSRQVDSADLEWSQDRFGDGLAKNVPHEDIPRNAVAGLINAHCKETEIEPRLASWLWAETQPPPWRDDTGAERRGYTLSKINNIVNSENSIFDASFVSCFIAWPVDDGYFHDEIIEFLSGYSVRVSVSGNRDSTPECYVHGRINMNAWHKRKKIKVWQIGNRVYTSPFNFSRFDECICVSRRMPSNVTSAWDDLDNHGMIGNSNGIFKVNFDNATKILWRANGPLPTVLLEGRSKRKEHHKRYDYLISMSRLAGQGLRDRTFVKVLQQSGTTALSTTVTPNRDYAIYWTEKPIGNDQNDKVGGKLVCGRLSDEHKDPGYYRTIAAPGASFKLIHNEREENFLVDMGATGANVQSMDDVAEALQQAINTLFPWVSCNYKEEGYFEFNTGEERNASISYLKTGETGTDIASTIKGTEEEKATVVTAWAYSAPNKIGRCHIPKDQGKYEWHWTHFTVWRTTDISKDGVDPRTTISGEELVPLKFTWVGDFRTAAAFYASKNNGVITADIGTFGKADEGTPFKWEDGEVDTINEYISPRAVRVSINYYGNSSKSLQAGAIGNGRVLRVSQLGDIVTLHSALNGDTFSNSECDTRKTLYMSDGYELIIKEVLSPNAVRVHDSATRSLQGATIDPEQRIITDTITDATLRNRMDEKHIGLLNMRFKEPLPNCNVLVVLPGFLLTAKRGGVTLPYCDLANNLKYNAGYHLASRQVIDDIEGSVQFICKSPNFFLVWCSDSLWGGPTNNPDIQDLPEFGEWYGVLHADIIDPDLGSVDWGSISEVANGAFELVCQDTSVRQLVNLSYGDDLTYNNAQQDLIARDLKKCWNIGVSIFGRTLGHVFWRTLK